MRESWLEIIWCYADGGDLENTKFSDNENT